MLRLQIGDPPEKVKTEFLSANIRPAVLKHCISS